MVAAWGRRNKLKEGRGEAKASEATGEAKSLELVGKVEDGDGGDF